MSLTIAIGWWLVPGLLTIASVLFLIIWKGFLADAGSDIGAQAVSGLLDLLVVGALMIVNLIAWLIWAIVV
ncbi:hypothetical protein GOC16_08375 [Sinorhizobium meliloti]|nr:hypothetical protein [Sinorhizobium meliloti]